MELTADARLTAIAVECGPQLLGYFSRRVEAREDAADLLSETLIIAWRKLDAVPEDAQERLYWLYAVARGVLANYQRGRRRRNALADRLRGHLRQQPSETAGMPSPAVLDMRQALAQLPPADRELLELVAWEGLRPVEAATVLKIPPATLRQRLKRARERLRSVIHS